jgi:hypothetical protein
MTVVIKCTSLYLAYSFLFAVCNSFSYASTLVLKYSLCPHEKYNLVFLRKISDGVKRLKYPIVGHMR